MYHDTIYRNKQEINPNYMNGLIYCKFQKQNPLNATKTLIHIYDSDTSHQTEKLFNILVYYFISFKLMFIFYTW